MSSAQSFIDWAAESGVRPLAMWEQARLQHLLQFPSEEGITRGLVERLYLTLVQAQEQEHEAPKSVDETILRHELPHDDPRDQSAEREIDEENIERRIDDFIDRLFDEDMINSREEREAEYAARAKAEGTE